MLEGIEPVRHNQGLYDELADMLNRYKGLCDLPCGICDPERPLVSAKPCTHATLQESMLQYLIINTITALRRDNVAFNEARFRSRIVKSLSSCR